MKKDTAMPFRDAMQERDFTRAQRLRNYKGIVKLSLAMAILHVPLVIIWPPLFLISFTAFIVWATALKHQLISTLRYLSDPKRRLLDDATRDARLADVKAFLGAWFEQHTEGSDRDIMLALYLRHLNGGGLVEIQTHVHEGRPFNGATSDRVLPRAALKEIWDILDPADDPRWISDPVRGNELSFAERYRFSEFSRHQQLRAFARVASVSDRLRVAELHDPILACGKKGGDRNTLSYCPA